MRVDLLMAAVGLGVPVGTQVVSQIANLGIPRWESVEVGALLVLGLMITRVSRWTGGVDQRLDGFDQRLDGLDRTVISLRTAINGVQVDVAALKADVGGLKPAVGRLQADMKELQADVKELQRQGQ